ncbi:hypothetical protein N325_07161, partial [Colius striatus]
ILLYPAFEGALVNSYSLLHGRSNLQRRFLCEGPFHSSRFPQQQLSILSTRQQRLISQVPAERAHSGRVSSTKGTHWAEPVAAAADEVNVSCGRSPHKKELVCLFMVQATYQIM